MFSMTQHPFTFFYLHLSTMASQVSVLNDTAPFYLHLSTMASQVSVLNDTAPFFLHLSTMASQVSILNDTAPFYLHLSTMASQISVLKLTAPIYPLLSTMTSRVLVNDTAFIYCTLPAPKHQGISSKYTQWHSTYLTKPKNRCILSNCTQILLDILVSTLHIRELLVYLISLIFLTTHGLATNCIFTSRHCT